MRRYADESDNPSWVSGTGTAASQVDIYTPALASNLNATRKVNGTTTTAYLNFGNLHGDTITTLELPATGYVSGPNELNVYDEYGVPQTPELDNRPVGVSSHTDTTQLFVLNYGSLGQPQRETNDGGIQFMGARGYNPVTGQFLSPDPVEGGNETPYNYPDDPINYFDTTGNWGLLASWAFGAILNAGAIALAAAGCVGLGPLCLLAFGTILTMGAGAISSGIEATYSGKSKADIKSNAEQGLWLGALPFGADKLISKSKKVVKFFSKFSKINSHKKLDSAISKGVGRGITGFQAIDKAKGYRGLHDFFKVWIF